MTFLRTAAAAILAACGLGAVPALAQTDSYRVEANDSTSIDITICNPEVYVSVAGDGDTDLDFVVRNPRGDTVHSDYDLTDITFFTLYRLAGSGCETHVMDVTNLGDVWNRFEITLTTVRADAAGTGNSGDSRNRNVSFVNNGKESIFYIYWSNIAASDWGIDRLGSSTLPAGQSWQTTVDDGSGACRFNFRAVTAGGREIMRRDVDVCATYTISFD